MVGEGLFDLINLRTAFHASGLQVLDLLTSIPPRVQKHRNGGLQTETRQLFEEAKHLNLLRRTQLHLKPHINTRIKTNINMLKDMIKTHYAAVLL